MTPNELADTPVSETLDVIVIGGGQSGLAIAWHLQRQDLRFLVLDAGPQVGHVWSSRWDSLNLFTAARYSALPGMAFPGDPGAYPSKDEAASYLRRYAETFQLPIRLNARVTQVRRRGPYFQVHTATEILQARQVVVATGPFQTPFVPPAAAGLAGTITQLHSSAYRNPDQLPAGRVLVVGGGNSGLQIADELARTRQVDVAIGTTATALPQRVLGKDLFWWLTRTGLMGKAADSRLGRRIRARGELVIGTSRKRLRRSGITFHGRVLDAGPGGVRFDDGSSVAPVAVVWATGFRSDYSWIDVPGAVADGQPVHERGVSPVPGLYYLGLPWQHTRGSALLGFVGADAAYLATHIPRTMINPGQEETRLGDRSAVPADASDQLVGAPTAARAI